MFQKLKNCFGKDPVNTGRQRELDIARGIALVFMTFSHSIEILGWFFDPNASSTPSWADVDAVIKAVAPVFIFCMGISLCYSRKKTPRDLTRRAIFMVGIVFLLEIARTAIPTFIEWLVFRDFQSIRYAYQFLCVDIMQFATLTLLTIALLKKLNCRPAYMLAVAVVFSIAGQLLQGVSTGSVIGDYAVGYLWHSHSTAYFPLLNWFILPVIGYALGYLWLRLEDKETFFRLITPIGAIFTIVYFVAMAIIGEWYYFSGGDYCGIGIIDVLVMFVVFLTILGVSHYIGRFFTKIGNVLESMGMRVNSVYCIHWTIYAFLYLALRCFVGENYVPMWLVIPVGALVLLLANIISYIYKKKIGREVEKL